MAAAATKTTIHEVPGRGFQARTAFLDPRTRQVRCYRAGGIRYARPLAAADRWRRARPLKPGSVQYGSREHPTDCTGQAAECPQPGGQHNALVHEDCLELNVWIPAGDPPAHGWPVFVYIHGGFLQWGSPNREHAAALLSETAVRAVVVTPAYRLNAFGFLASAAFRAVEDQIVSNVGFWDQRLALEWTASHIADYGGDPANITVGGLSAGAYSTFHQLAYDALRAPRSRRLIRRVVLWSNGCGVLPKAETEVQSHVEMLLRALDIPTSLDAGTQLARLRAVPAATLAKAVETLPENAFRAVIDPSEPEAFIGTDLFARLRSGDLARHLQASNVRILCGEVRDEINSYRLNSPPSSYRDLVRRLAVEFPIDAADRMARLYCNGKETLPPGYTTWQDIFGRIYADMQVHVSQRGLLSCLHPILPASHIYRYQIHWRPRCVDAKEPPEMGVCHGTDLSIWWFGNDWGSGLDEEEKNTARKMLDPYAKFLAGNEDMEWGTSNISDIRVILADGQSVEIQEDRRWEEGKQKWMATLQGQQSRL